MTTDISEKGLETLIMLHMTGEEGFFIQAEGAAAETPDELAGKKAEGAGWLSPRNEGPEMVGGSTGTRTVARGREEKEEGETGAACCAAESRSLPACNDSRLITICRLFFTR